MISTLAELYGQMGLLGCIITGLIIVFFLIGFYANILIRRNYISLSQELAAYCEGEITEFQSDMLAWITEEYKMSLEGGIQNINTLAIIDMALSAYLKLCTIGESYLRKVNGLLITLGLFGTFLGLTSAVGEIGNMMSQTTAETLMTEAGINTFRILISSFKGMSVAFITSLFGTGFSIVLSVLTTFISSQDTKKLFVTQLEEYLDIKVATEVMENKVSEVQEKKSDSQMLADSLSDSIAQLNKSVHSYTEDLEFLKTFNRELRENICRADNIVSIVNQALKTSSEAFWIGSESFIECSNELKKVAVEIKNYNQRLESMSGIFEELSKKLDESTQDRAAYVKTINEMPDRLLNYTEAAVARIERGL